MPHTVPLGARPNAAGPTRAATVARVILFILATAVLVALIPSPSSDTSTIGRRLGSSVSPITNPLAALTPRLPWRTQRHDFRLDKAEIARDMVYRVKGHQLTFTCYDVYSGTRVERVDNLTLPKLMSRGGFSGEPRQVAIIASGNVGDAVAARRAIAAADLVIRVNGGQATKNLTNRANVWVTCDNVGCRRRRNFRPATVLLSLECWDRDKFQWERSREGLPKLAVKNQTTRGRLWSFCRPAPRAVGDLLCRSDPSRGMQAALLFASVYGVQRVKLFGYSDDMQYSDGTAMKIWHDQYKEHAALRDVGLLPPVSAGGEAGGG